MTQILLKIQRGLKRCYFAQAARLYDEAFGEIFALAIPNSGNRRLMLESCFMQDFAFVAIENGELRGLAGFNTTDGALTGGGSLKSLYSQLGFFQAVRAVLVFAFFKRKPEEHELLMDGIAVSLDSRGKGVGSDLLDCIIQFAAGEGYKTVCLEVIDTNPLAKKLYKRKGFKAQKTQHFPLLKRLLGFASSTTMILTISE